MTCPIVFTFQDAICITASSVPVLHIYISKIEFMDNIEILLTLKILDILKTGALDPPPKILLY